MPWWGSLKAFFLCRNSQELWIHQVYQGILHKKRWEQINGCSSMLYCPTIGMPPTPRGGVEHSMFSSLQRPWVSLGGPTLWGISQELGNPKGISWKKKLENVKPESSNSFSTFGGRLLCAPLLEMGMSMGQIQVPQNGIIQDPAEKGPTFTGIES